MGEVVAHEVETVDDYGDIAEIALGSTVSRSVAAMGDLFSIDQDGRLVHIPGHLVPALLRQMRS
jgi:hypothetical protein